MYATEAMTEVSAQDISLNIQMITLSRLLYVVLPEASSCCTYVPCIHSQVWAGAATEL